eukprot:4864895-Amphidinium_carterae.1
MVLFESTLVKSPCNTDCQSALHVLPEASTAGGAAMDAEVGNDDVSDDDVVEIVDTKAEVAPPATTTSGWRCE